MSLAPLSILLLSWLIDHHSFGLGFIIVGVLTAIVGVAAYLLKKRTPYSSSRDANREENKLHQKKGRQLDEES